MTTISWPPGPLWFNTPKGLGKVLFVTDRGDEADAEWTFVIMEGDNIGQVWAFTNLEIRMCKNITMGRVPQQLIEEIMMAQGKSHKQKRRAIIATTHGTITDTTDRMQSERNQGVDHDKPFTDLGKIALDGVIYWAVAQKCA